MFPLHPMRKYNIIHRFLQKFASSFCIISSLLLVGCSSNKNTSVRPSYSHTSTHQSSKQEKASHASMPKNEHEKRLISEANKWLGTPYKFGGNTKAGVDCSGFVCNLFNETFNIKIPRNSAKQHEFCHKVKKAELRIGDLIFFATNSGSRAVSHVGLYVGDGQMIHASTRKGVIYQDIETDYYAKAFIGVGRIEQFDNLCTNRASIKTPNKSHDSKQHRESGQNKPTSMEAASMPTKPSVPEGREQNQNSVPTHQVGANPEPATTQPQHTQSQSQSHSGTSVPQSDDPRSKVLSTLPELR